MVFQGGLNHGLNHWFKPIGLNQPTLNWINFKQDRKAGCHKIVLKMDDLRPDLKQILIHPDAKNLFRNIKRIDLFQNIKFIHWLGSGLRFRTIF